MTSADLAHDILTALQFYGRIDGSTAAAAENPPGALARTALGALLLAASQGVDDAPGEEEFAKWIALMGRQAPTEHDLRTMYAGWRAHAGLIALAASLLARGATSHVAGRGNRRPKGGA